MAPHPSTQTQPIGVFDSGFGGLTVVRALRRTIPDEQVIYLGDTARLPYGTKSPNTIIHYTKQVAAFLVQHNAKILVAACNTASALGVGPVSKRLETPMIGVVEPGAELAAQATRTGSIGVLGTLSTISSAAYQNALQRINPKLLVHGQACPLLVPLVEEAWIEHPVTDQVIRHYLSELRVLCPDIDTLILGCTHYPLLKKPIEKIACDVFDSAVTLIDSAEAVATAVKHVLEEKKLSREPGTRSQNDNDTFFFTDANRFSEVAPRFLGEAIENYHQVDLDQHAS